MNRKIFRGKSLNNGKWVFGSLLIGVCNCWIAWEQESGKFDMVAVHPETATQSINLLDVNGYAIFEGDLVQSVWGHIYEVVELKGAIKVKNKNGFYFDIQDVCQPVIIGSIYENL